MQTNEQLLDLLENYLAQRELPTEPERLYDPIRYSLAGGGKRLRPMLLLLSCGLFADDVDVALPAAAAVEIFHNFTLLHDDIMDNAAVRRGKPSVYARWGGNVAILSGDAMLISAYRLLAQAPPALLPRILEVFNTMALGVCEGQQYDMDFESKQKVSVVEYMSMIELKTSVLVAGSAMMGAILGGADEEQSRRLYQFAIELGMAFQLQDDLLDSYGGEELGKTIGGDILEGKKSYLMVTAMSRADEEQREMLGAYGIEESGLLRVIHSGYKALGLASYFTAGEKEVRAWTIQDGWKAPQAAGVIHTDFERGFIRAEVIGFDDYVKYKTEAACRTASLTELERGRRVLGGKNLFHGRFVRFQTTEHPMHFLKDDPEPGSELSVKRRADDPAIHKLEHAGHFAHHSPPRIPGTGIDADDGDGLRHEKKEGRDFRAPNGSTARRRGPPYAPR